MKIRLTHNNWNEWSGSESRSSFDKTYPSIATAREFLSKQPHPSQYIAHTQRFPMLADGEVFLQKSIFQITGVKNPQTYKIIGWD